MRSVQYAVRHIQLRLHEDSKTDAEQASIILYFIKARNFLTVWNKQICKREGAAVAWCYCAQACVCAYTHNTQTHTHTQTHVNIISASLYVHTCACVLMYRYVTCVCVCVCIYIYICILHFVTSYSKLHSCDFLQYFPTYKYGYKRKKIMMMIIIIIITTIQNHSDNTWATNRERTKLRKYKKQPYWALHTYCGKCWCTRWNNITCSTNCKYRTATTLHT